ncbi:hypothetical protein PRK78_000976 [Emydomyces testavorans]|uniref:Uncharacterized protein n=1 Tax=Emydomyces testavorans TaxID=2070801 RepID=A0AAF0DC41_9EURO|nr:hypothetical protein PRK78_000976 [Emydomyces testavorans]
MAEPDEIYQFLTAVFAGRNDQIYDIEILPPGFGPLLSDGTNIGITKRALVQAFLIARRIFFDSIKNSSLSGCAGNVGELSRQEDVRLKVASEIMLLFDSEHLTACNWRKRTLHILKDSQLPDRYIRALREEVSFTTILLRSPLHRHAKSPTLWHHRYWVMTEAFRLGPGHVNSIILSSCDAASGPLDADDMAISEKLFQHELAVTLRAGEQHHMNYYAFSYLRQFLGILRCFLNGYSFQPNDDLSRLKSDGISNEIADSDITSRLLQPLRKGLLEEIHKWCLSHPRDISGWTFLLHLLELVDDAPVQTAIVEKTVRYAFDVAWEGEALWVFVSLSISKFSIDFDGLFLVDYKEIRHEINKPAHATHIHRPWTELAARVKARPSKDIES